MMRLAFIYVAAGIFLALIGLPLLAEKVPPNGWYGFRVRATLEDRALWYAVNRFAAQRLIWSGASIVAAALVLFIVPGLTADEYSLVCLAVFVVAMAIGLMQSFRYLKRLTR